MKKDCKLFLSELGILWKIYLPFFFILAILFALLISVTDLAVEIPRNYYEFLDKEKKLYAITVNDVPAVDYQKIASVQGNFCLYFEKGLTSDVSLFNSQGKELPSYIEEENENGLFIKFISGAAADSSQHNLTYYKPLTDNLKAGEWRGEKDIEGIYVCAYIADKLDLNINDGVYIGGASYTVKGIYDFPSDGEYGYFDYYIDSDRLILSDEQFISAHVYFTSSEKVYSAYKDLKKEGWDVYVDSDLINSIKNIETSKVGLIVFACILALAAVAVNVGFINIVIGKRINFINLSRVLGGGNKAAGVYALQFLTLIFIALLTAACAAIGINKYFTAVFAGLFGFSVTIKYNVIVPIISAVAAAVMTLCTFFIFVKKINRISSAENFKRYEE